MSAEFSISSNDPLHFTSNSSINSSVPFGPNCFFSTMNMIIFSVYNITIIFILLPLCIFILHHGLQQWRKSHSSSSSAAMSHSDSFMYSLVNMEIIGALGCSINLCAIYIGNFSMLTVGLYLLSLTYFGEMFSHILVCLERYLAVIHPITYLSLRNERGIRIRNICIGCVWLLSFVILSFSVVHPLLTGVSLFMVTLSLTVVSFCSVSVLWVLIRPGPGKLGGGKERVDKSKQRAFYNIVAILGVLVLRFVWEMSSSAMYISRGALNCGIVTFGFCLYIPSSLVLPFLFLVTKKKLKRNSVCCTCSEM